MKYYCIKQNDITDCGAACLATICKQNGYKIGITQIREVAGTDKQGTNAYGVIKAAEQLGFSAKGVKGNKEAFFSEFPLPCIAHVIVDGNLLHYTQISFIMSNLWHKRRNLYFDRCKATVTKIILVYFLNTIALKNEIL